MQPQAAYYYPNGSTVSFNFTGLTTGNSYTLYVVGSDNDPSIFANYTTVQAIAVSTNSTVFSTTYGTRMIVAIPMIALWAIIALVIA